MIPIDADLDLDRIAAAVRSCPAVSRICAAGPDRDRGPLAISYNPWVIDISVIAFYGIPLSVVVEQIEQAVRPLISDRRVRVTIDDLDTPTPEPD